MRAAITYDAVGPSTSFVTLLWLSTNLLLDRFSC